MTRIALRVFVGPSSCGAVLAAVLLALGGCASATRSGPVPAFTLDAAPAGAKPGELVTVRVQPGGLSHEGYTIDWITSGGTLTTERRAEIARVRFDAAGTYHVTAKLMRDANEVRRQTADIVVAP